MMGKECLELIRDIGRYDIVVGVGTTLLLIPLLGGGAGLFLLGIGCSFINFVINSYVNNMLSGIKNFFNAILFVTSYAIRIGLVCSIAILLIVRKELFFYIFIAGYSAQVISIVIYGLKLKTREGV